jgi:hypothetical protein
MIKAFFPVKEKRLRDKKRKRIGLRVGKKVYRITQDEAATLCLSLNTAYVKATEPEKE